MIQTKAILFTGVNQIAVDTVHISEPGPGEVLIEAAYTCISPGTELRNLSVQQDGKQWPFIPGYAMSGTIIACGPETTLKEGTRVFCNGTAYADQARMWGGHIAHAVRSEKQVYVLPQSVDLLAGSIVKLAAIALHGVGFSRPALHERVALIGLGLIGQLSARLHTMTGARVICTDLSAERVALAQAGGVQAVVLQGGLQETLSELLPDGADVIVDATGHPSVLAQAIKLARDVPWDDSLTQGTRYIIQGSYAGNIDFPYRDAFMREISVYMPRDNQARDIRAVLELLAREKLHVRDLISAVRTPEEAPATYQQLQTAPGELLTAAFKWH